MDDPALQRIMEMRVDEAIEAHRRAMETFRNEVKRGVKLTPGDVERAHDRLYDEVRRAVTDE